jgi:Holliday junction resolvasome RuvABC endonuclease subunit
MNDILIVDPHTHFYSYIWLNDDKFVIMNSEASFNLVADLIGKNIFKLVIIEDQYVGRNAKTSLDLAAAQGMILGICELFKTKVIQVAPMKWKSWLKRMKITKKDLELAIESDNEHLCDCWGMYLYYQNVLKSEEK